MGFIEEYMLIMFGFLSLVALLALISSYRNSLKITPSEARETSNNLYLLQLYTNGVFNQPTLDDILHQQKHST